MQDELYTLQEVANILKVSKRTLFRYLKAGNLKGFKLTDSRTGEWRIPKKDLNSFINKNRK